MKILAQYTELTPYQTQEQWNLVEVRGEEWVIQHRVKQLNTWSIGEMESTYPGILKVLKKIQASKSEGFWTTEEERTWGYLYENPLIKTQEVEKAEWLEGMGT